MIDVDLGQALSATASVASIVQELLSKKVDKDTMSLILQLQSAYAVLAGENERLKRENEELKKLADKEGSVEICKDLSFRYKFNDGTLSEPICQNCYEQKNIYVLLESIEDYSYCSNCNTTYPNIKTNVHRSAGADVFYG